MSHIFNAQIIINNNVSRDICVYLSHTIDLFHSVSISLVLYGLFSRLWRSIIWNNFRCLPGHMLRCLLLWHKVTLLFRIYLRGWYGMSIQKKKNVYNCLYVQIHSYYFTNTFRFIVPVSMIVINDVMAYMFGFFFGRTPLIKLSPKKTWEGFIGGGISTVIFGLLVIYIVIVSENKNYFPAR